VAKLTASGSGPTPAGWRNVYSAFNNLKSIAAKGGRNVSGWHIDVPTGLKKITKQWIMVWTPPHFKTNQTVNAGLGTDAYSAVRAIEGLTGLYIEQIKSEQKHASPKRTAESGAFVIKNPQRPSPVTKLAYDFIDIVQQHGKWGIENHGTERMKKLAKMRAGILNISMLQFALTEMAVVFRRPPATEEELRWMRSQLDDYHELQRQAGFEVGSNRQSAPPW
jgi:hypothetical protein